MTAHRLAHAGLRASPADHRIEEGSLHPVQARYAPVESVRACQGVRGNACVNAREKAGPGTKEDRNRWEEEVMRADQ